MKSIALEENPALKLTGRKACPLVKLSKHSKSKVLIFSEIPVAPILLFAKQTSLKFSPLAQEHENETAKFEFTCVKKLALGSMLYRKHTKSFQLL